MLRNSSQSPLAMMRAVANEDASAQEALVERLSVRVLAVSRRLCGSLSDAEDAAQIALLEILRSAKNFRAEASLEGWADRITVRTALRTQNRERRRAALIERWAPLGRLPWGARAYVSPQEPLDVEVFLGRLSPTKREAFVLRYALEFSVEEIAEITDAPVGTVKDRLHSARKELKKAIEREHAQAQGSRKRGAQ